MKAVVYGPPASQGSKRAFVVKGRAVMCEASARLPSWRDAMIASMRMTAPQVPHTGAILLQVEIYVTRPKNHFTKKGLKEGMPRYPPSGRVDADKVARAVCDAGTYAGWWKDDNQVQPMVFRLYDEVVRTEVIAVSLE